MSNRYLSTLFKSGEEFEEFLNKLDAFKKGIEKGTIIIPEATKATQDANGNNIAETYAVLSNLANGTTIVYKADCDRQGSVIHTAYAKKTDLTSGKITVQKATQDANGNNIADTYLAKSALNKITAAPSVKSGFLSKAGYYYVELRDSSSVTIPLGVMYWNSDIEVRKVFYVGETAYTFSILTSGGSRVKQGDTVVSKFSIYINPWQ